MVVVWVASLGRLHPERKCGIGEYTATAPENALIFLSNGDCFLPAGLDRFETLYMAKPATTAEAIQEYSSDIFELDAFLFPDSWPLSLHQIWMYRQFERHTKRWLEWNRGAGKSSTIGRYFAIKKAQELHKVVYSGPTYRQSRHPFRYERDFILTSPWLSGELAKQPTENTDRSEIVFKNGSKSTALPASKTKIHGERATDLVVTEFFDYPKDLFARTVKPMLLGGRVSLRRTVTYETSAGLVNSFAYERRKHFLRMVERGHPDYCFISVDFEDLKATGFLSEDDIANVEEDREIDPAIWNQQYMNVWLSVTGSFYELSLLRREELRHGVVLRKAREGYTYVAGLDVARGRSDKDKDSAIVVWEIPKSLEVPPAVVFAQKWHNKTADELAREVAPILARFAISLLVMDFKGGGVSVFDKLRLEHGYVEVDDEYPGRRIVMPFPHTPAVINETHFSLRGAFEMDAIILPERPEEDDLVKPYETIDLGLVQLADLETRRLGSGYLSFDAPPGRKSDVGIAGAYGYYGVRLLRQPERRPEPRGAPLIESGLSAVLYPDLHHPLLGP